MMTTYHISCGAVVRISPGVPGSNPGWKFSFFSPQLANNHYTNFIFYSWWNLGVAVLGVYMCTMGVISGQFFSA